MEHVVLDCMGIVRLTPPTRDGAPKAPVNPLPVRVSTTRQGVMAMKVRGFGSVGAAGPARSGCQYSGAGQWRRGTRSRRVWALSSIGTTAKTSGATMDVFIVQLPSVFRG